MHARRPLADAAPRTDPSPASSYWHHPAAQRAGTSDGAAATTARHTPALLSYTGLASLRSGIQCARGSKTSFACDDTYPRRVAQLAQVSRSARRVVAHLCILYPRLRGFGFRPVRMYRNTLIYNPPTLLPFNVEAHNGEIDLDDAFSTPFHPSASSAALDG
ncbi:hypothetical protein CERSUDRAFT_95778 [Gelatoporia subvermispora B]|uniref:Uncharacterized protein n=1 Tax=Ceriporiopsis subvermispora (strain B) TaxID=914234 RepID=M2QWH7_CERS8|nr:hypothetical protein CERSUDRAFT_95778 [Gelatoporia subvermispora B]